MSGALHPLAGQTTHLMKKKPVECVQNGNGCTQSTPRWKTAESGFLSWPSVSASIRSHSELPQ